MYSVKCHVPSARMRIEEVKDIICSTSAENSIENKDWSKVNPLMEMEPPKESPSNIGIKPKHPLYLIHMISLESNIARSAFLDNGPAGLGSASVSFDCHLA